MYVFVRVFVFVSVCVCASACACACVRVMFICARVCVYVRVYVCVCVCTCWWHFDVIPFQVCTRLSISELTHINFQNISDVRGRLRGARERGYWPSQNVGQTGEGV